MRDGQTDREKERETFTDIYRKTEGQGQTDGLKDRQKDRQIVRQTDRKANRWKYTQRWNRGERGKHGRMVKGRSKGNVFMHSAK